MKQNCNGCKALIKSIRGIGCECELNHPIRVDSELYGIPVSYKPIEECEKPMTNKTLCEIYLRK